MHTCVWVCVGVCVCVLVCVGSDLAVWKGGDGSKQIKNFNEPRWDIFLIYLYFPDQATLVLFWFYFK